MGYLFTFASLICIFSNVKSQDLATYIQGTWKVKNNSYVSYTATHFTRNEIDTVTQAISKSVFGRYSIANGIYSETVLSADNASMDQIGKTSTLIMRMEGHDKIIVPKIGNGNTETWERETIRIMRRLSFDSGGGSHSMSKEDLLRPLYVIHNGTKAVSLKNVVEKGESPMRLIPQEIIGSIDVLKDEDANALFGNAGKYGVIVIRILSSDIFNQLKNNGYKMSNLNRFQSQTIIRYRR